MDGFIFTGSFHILYLCLIMQMFRLFLALLIVLSSLSISISAPLEQYSWVYLFPATVLQIYLTRNRVIQQSHLIIIHLSSFNIGMSWVRYRDEGIINHYLFLRWVLVPCGGFWLYHFILDDLKLSLLCLQLTGAVTPWQVDIKTVWLHDYELVYRFSSNLQSSLTLFG